MATRVKRPFNRGKLYRALKVCGHFQEVNAALAVGGRYMIEHIENEPDYGIKGEAIIMQLLIEKLGRPEIERACAVVRMDAPWTMEGL